jgi:radical SAM protein with 4Fe4S-binding SPASM domain
MNHKQRFVRLADHVSLRLLEEPCLYDRRADELYELNHEAIEGLQRCRGDLTLEQAELESEFADFCLEEVILELSQEPRPKPLPICQGPLPSLRYLEAQVTWRCNLACTHCYLGKARPVDMDVADFAALVREFEAMGGLRLLISGGEPLMHPNWNELNAVLAGLPVRRVLLSNGLMLDHKTLASLNCDEVQISLDGLERGHELLRGQGSFAKAVEAARRVVQSGLKLSIATMAHAGNLDEMPGLAGLVEDLGAGEWGVDAPCIAGRLAQEPETALSAGQAAQAMEYAFGGAYHGGSGGMACGLHLCTVGADGKVAQCGFYFDSSLGQMQDGLWTCWARRKPVALSQVPVCAACRVSEDCGGGCRFRAPAPDQPDPVMCALYGIAN